MKFQFPRKAMILAAGRGERMRPLTDTCPKPLLKAGGKTLIEYHIESLVEAGMNKILVNHAYLGEQIVKYLGDGSTWHARITHLEEPEGALETGGGIVNALPKLGKHPFLVINGDIWTDIDFAGLTIPKDSLAHLILVDNPPHNPEGDFHLKNNQVKNSGKNMLTFSGIGIYRKELFDDVEAGAFPLAPLLREAAKKGLVSGEHYKGKWTDVGTPERLAKLDKALN